MKMVALAIIIDAMVFLSACDDSNTRNKVTTPTVGTIPTVNETKIPYGVGTFLIEADGVLYRCFDTGSNVGGLWCTRKP